MQGYGSPVAYTTCISEKSMFRRHCQVSQSRLRIPGPAYPLDCYGRNLGNGAPRFETATQEHAEMLSLEAVSGQTEHIVDSAENGKETLGMGDRLEPFHPPLPYGG